ncbi:MAG: Rossmann-like and DUF2520 domain-containing protein [Roseburia sp.]
MRIGFIGAGKVGFSLGKYFAVNGIEVTGYFSRNLKSAEAAAEFTDTRYFEKLEDLVRDSEVLFLTVPDGAIAQVWEQLKEIPITEKVICHCSGVLSSEIFSDISKAGAFGYSIHPFLAVNDKLHSYEELSKALFTIEGDFRKKEEMRALFVSLGNQVLFLEAKEKIRYHAAAVMASNLVLGLAETAMEELAQCDFSKEQAAAALAPLMLGNVTHLLEDGVEHALTGPVERCDTGTVERHMEVLQGKNLELYRLLSEKALTIAKRKNPERNYEKMEDILKHE